MVAASAFDAETPVDLKVLARLMGDSTPESLRRMLTSFWESEGATPGALRKLAEARDGDGLAEAAHGAKGAAFYIGAGPAADLCRALEVSARAGDWAAIAVLMTQVEKAYAEIGVFIAGGAA